MNVRTILVPVDFSDGSRAVVREVAELAVRLDAEVVLLHVAELPPGFPADTIVRPEGADVPASDYLLRDAHDRLRSFVVAARDLGATVRESVRVGPVVPTILAAVGEVRADLVVMSTHGRTGLARLVLGSVAEAVTHKTQVPILLVRRDIRGAEEDRSPAEDQVRAETTG